MDWWQEDKLWMDDKGTNWWIVYGWQGNDWWMVDGWQGDERMNLWIMNGLCMTRVWIDEWWMVDVWQADELMNDEW